MSLKYELVQRKDRSEGAGPDAKLYYPQMVFQGRVSFEDLCEQVAEESALTSAEVKACMDRIVRIVARNLKEGRSVDCGDLGSFKMNLRSAGTITKEEYDPAVHMRTPGVQYYPGKFLRDTRETKLIFERIQTEEEATE